MSHDVDLVRSAAKRTIEVSLFILRAVVEQTLSPCAQTHR